MKKIKAIVFDTIYISLSRDGLISYEEDLPAYKEHMKMKYEITLNHMINPDNVVKYRAMFARIGKIENSCETAEFYKRNGTHCYISRHQTGHQNLLSYFKAQKEFAIEFANYCIDRFQPEFPWNQN